MVEALRRQCYTGKQIAIEADVSPATVSRILRRIGLNRLSAQVIGREESQRHDLSQGGSRQAGRSDPARHDRQRLLLSSRAIAKACKRLSLKHIRIKPYTPKTNDKAERFIQTSLHEWPAPTTPQTNAPPKFARLAGVNEPKKNCPCVRKARAMRSARMRR